MGVMRKKQGSSQVSTGWLEEPLQSPECQTKEL